MAAVLLVDDDRFTLEALASMVNRLGHQLVSCPDAASALEASSEQAFAVAILDVRMPETDGVELARQLHAQEHTRSLPVIFLTGIDGEDESVLRGYEAGAFDVMFKPPDPGVIAAKVKAFVQLHELQEALRAEVEQRRAAEAELRAQESRLEELIDQRTAALARANRELESFARHASHDLRAPLRTIVGFSNMLVEDINAGDVDAAKVYAGRMEAAAMRLMRLVEALSEMSRNASSGDIADMELDEVVREVLLDLGEPAAKAQVTVEKLPRVRGDRQQFYRLFLNLISNAIKYSRPGKSAQVWIGSTGAGPNFTEVVVRDAGIGFDNASAKDIFKPLVRLHAERDFEGDGLGLAVCQRVVEVHGGQIQAEGRPNEGATFRLTLPSSRS